MPLLSVEISTYNRKDILRLNLDRLARQTTPPAHFEVVVSDDGSSDGTAEMIEAIGPSLPYELRFVPNDHRGVGGNHNAGIRECRSNLVLMIADDILAEPQLVEEHIKYHARHPNPAAFIVGRIAQSPELPRSGFQKSWDARLNAKFPNAGAETRFGYTNFWVSNLSFKRSFMLEFGMFQEWPSAAHEDLELGYRLQRRGMTLFFNPRALGYHHHAETIESTAARAYAQGYQWHHFESCVPDRWVRIRSRNVRLADGPATYAITLAKKGAHRILLNRLTMSALILPLARLGEQAPLVYSLMPLLPRFITHYSFHRGVMDYQAGRSHHFPLAKRLLPQ